MDAWPLVQCFAWDSAICTRYDLVPKGPTYVEQEMMKALEKLDALTPPKPKARPRAARARRVSGR